MINTREFVIADYDAAVALWNRLEGIEIAEGDKKDEISAYLLRNPDFSRVAEEEGVMVGVRVAVAVGVGVNVAVGVGVRVCLTP